MKRMTAELADWLRSRMGDNVVVDKLHGDISGRLFWRVFSGKETLILMDSGTIPIWPWLDIHELLATKGFPVPSVMDCNTKKGWVLQEDLGDLRLLDANDDDYGEYIDDALDLLFHMQRELDGKFCSGSIAGRRSFTPAFFMAELENTLESLFFRLLSVPMDDLLSLQAGMRNLCGMIDEASVFTHRDFHSANLIIHKKRLIMVDWQDARFGPSAYDLVSLLRDSYRDIGLSWEDRAKKYIHAQGKLNIFQVALTACQRSLKAAGTFSHQYRKTGDTSFLGYLPRTFRYLGDYARICPQLENLVDSIYSALDTFSGEIDLRDFRYSDIPGIQEK